MKQKEIINNFLDKNNIFAVIGVSKDESKYGRKIFEDLKKAGYKVFPINPNLKFIDDEIVYPNLKELPIKPDIVNLVVPPIIANKILIECKNLGITKIWFQPGSESKEGIDFCEQNKFETIHDSCIMIEKKTFEGKND